MVKRDAGKGTPARFLFPRIIYHPSPGGFFVGGQDKMESKEKVAVNFYEGRKMEYDKTFSVLLLEEIK